MDKIFLTVSEFAELAGVSLQAVYKRLSGDLKEFTIKENGKKLVNKAALSYFQPNLNQVESVENIFNLGLNQFESVKSNKHLKKPQIFGTTKETNFQLEVERLKNVQLEESIRLKDGLIAKLEERVKNLENRLEQKDQDLTALIGKITILFDQQQQLQLHQIQQNINSQVPDIEEKKSLWQRIFNK